MLRSAPLLLPLLLAACEASDPTALRLRLVFDPELQSERQILTAVERLELVLDASGGFAGISASGQRVGELSAADSDGDGVLELVLTRALKGQPQLPLLRLLPGSNGNRAFQITARGLAGAELAAFGGLGAVRFAQGSALDVLVPFNLRPAFLPPRVLFTLPHDGETRAPATLGQIYLEFSKQVSPASAKSGLRLIYQTSGAGELTVPGEWTLGENQIDDLGLPTRRTTATFQSAIGCTLSAGSYRIEASTAILDLSGVALDQKADNETPDGYLGRFTIPGQAEDSACAKSSIPCKRDEDCGELTQKQYVCDLPSGHCVLASASCPALPCPKGYVCQSGGTGAASKCVQDCRIAGSCAGAQDTCDPASGACLPCEAKAVDPKCGAVTEELTCVFEGSATEQKCISVKGTCSGFGSCTVAIAGSKGEVVTWSSSCGGADQQSTIDGTDKKLLFKCSTPGTPVQEEVKCIFTPSTASQECSSDLGPACKGVGSCLVKVSGTLGQKVSWKSTCGGYATTILDGKSESVSFPCK